MNAGRGSYLSVTWTDEATGHEGQLVVDRLVRAGVVVEAANLPVTALAEASLSARGVTIVPGVAHAIAEDNHAEGVRRWGRRRPAGRR